MICQLCKKPIKTGQQQELWRMFEVHKICKDLNSKDEKKGKNPTRFNVWKYNPEDCDRIERKERREQIDLVSSFEYKMGRLL